MYSQVHSTDLLNIIFTMYLLTIPSLVTLAAATVLPTHIHGPAHLHFISSRPFNITAPNNITNPANTTSTQTDAIPDSIANFNFTPEFSFPLTQLFSEIESIPDRVLLEGDEVLHRYFIAAGMRAPDVPLSKLNPDVDNNRSALPGADEETLKPRASIWQILKCVGAIVQLLVSTAIPAAKILRIKKLIAELGGVRRAVELMLKATTREEKLRVGGQTLVALAAEVLGISSVQTHCF